MPRSRAHLTALDSGRIVPPRWRRTSNRSNAGARAILLGAPSKKKRALTRTGPSTHRRTTWRRRVRNVPAQSAPDRRANVISCAARKPARTRSAQLEDVSRRWTMSAVHRKPTSRGRRKGPSAMATAIKVTNGPARRAKRDVRTMARKSPTRRERSRLPDRLRPSLRSERPTDARAKRLR